MRWFEGSVTTPRVGPSAEVTRRLEAELVRGRRHGSSVSLVVLVDRRGRSAAPVVSLLALVEGAVRRYDVVFPQADGSLVVLAPDAGAEAARELVRRLSDLSGCACAASTASEGGDEVESMLRRAIDRLADLGQDRQQ